MLKPEFTGQFKKDYKRAVKRGCRPEYLEEVITLLCEEKPLPEKFRDHQLQNSRNYKGMRECHIEPDWLLIYRKYLFLDLSEQEHIATYSDQNVKYGCIR